MKTTLKEIKAFPAIDINDISEKYFNDTILGEHKTVIAYSKGQYGINGMVWYLPNLQVFVKCTLITSRYYRFY